MIEQEKIVHALQFEKRYEEFRQILDGTHEEELSKKYIFYVFGTIAFTYLITCYLTLIPITSVIENPEHWFEQQLHAIGLPCPLIAGHIIFTCSFLMNIRYIKTIKHWFVLSLAGYACCIITFPTVYLTWTYGLKYRWPLPYIGYVNAYLMAPTMYVTLWYRFPRQWRKNKKFRDRFKFFFVSDFGGFWESPNPCFDWPGL